MTSAEAMGFSVLRMRADRSLTEAAVSLLETFGKSAPKFISSYLLSVADPQDRHSIDVVPFLILVNAHHQLWC